VARKVTRKPLLKLEHEKLVDPIAEALRPVLSEQRQLEERLQKLENSSGIVTPEDEFRDRRKKIVSESSQGGENEI
jgi:serine O-acetyltransferase